MLFNALLAMLYISIPNQPYVATFEALFIHKFFFFFLPNVSQKSYNFVSYMLDINECTKGICDTTSTDCVNVPGTYRCTCKNGFEGGSASHCEGDHKNMAFQYNFHNYILYSVNLWHKSI